MFSNGCLLAKIPLEVFVVHEIFESCSDHISNFHFHNSYFLTGVKQKSSFACEMLSDIVFASPAGVCADLSCVGAAEMREPQINGSVCWA